MTHSIEAAQKQQGVRQTHTYTLNLNRRLGESMTCVISMCYGQHSFCLRELRVVAVDPLSMCLQ